MSKKITKASETIPHDADIIPLSTKTNDGTKSQKPIAKKTLFVRNLAISTTQQDLEDAFSEIGPLRRCFIITDPDNNQMCNGYGFVQFALETDASRAIKSLQGHKIGGKSILIDWAKPRTQKAYIPKHLRVEDEQQQDDQDSDEDMAPILAPTKKPKLPKSPISKM
jgi:nucleolar protein 4